MNGAMLIISTMKQRTLSEDIQRSLQIAKFLYGIRSLVAKRLGVSRACVTLVVQGRTKSRRIAEAIHKAVQEVECKIFPKV